MNKPIFNKVDCIRLYVPDLDEGLSFYRDKLGHSLIWRSDTAAGLKIQGQDTEIVLQTTEEGVEIDLAVESVPDAMDRIIEAGGKIVAGPFDIQIGKCAVIEDPWHNQLVILDTSKGLLRTDQEGNIIGHIME